MLRELSNNPCSCVEHFTDAMVVNCPSEEVGVLQDGGLHDNVVNRHEEVYSKIEQGSFLMDIEAWRVMGVMVWYLNAEMSQAGNIFLSFRFEQRLIHTEDGVVLLTCAD